MKTKRHGNKTNARGEHPSYARLVDAAAARGIVGELAVCRALNLGAQSIVNNWQRRGVSKSGALDAEKYLSVSAVWILDGVDPFEQ